MIPTIKKKNLISGLLLILLALLSTPTHAQNNTEISAHLQGLTDKRIIVIYLKKGVTKIDTVKIIKGNFKWKGEINEPQKIQLLMAKNNFYFFIQPGHITLKGIKDSVQTYFVSGSAIQKESESFEASVKNVTDQEEVLFVKHRKGTPDERVVLEVELDSLKKQRRIKEDQYIGDHPRSFYSLNLLTDRAAYGADYSEINFLYNKLSAWAKQTEAGKKIAQRLNVLYKSRLVPR